MSGMTTDVMYMTLFHIGNGEPVKAPRPARRRLIRAGLLTPDLQLTPAAEAFLLQEAPRCGWRPPVQLGPRPHPYGPINRRISGGVAAMALTAAIMGIDPRR